MKIKDIVSGVVKAALNEIKKDEDLNTIGSELTSLAKYAAREAFQVVERGIRRANDRRNGK